MSVKDQIRQQLWECGIHTAYAASQKTGMAQRSIDRILSGEVSPSVGTIQRLFEPLGIEVSLAFRKQDEK